MFSLSCVPHWDIYNVTTLLVCYQTLFVHKQKSLEPVFVKQTFIAVNDPSYSIKPDLNNKTSLDLVCRSLDRDECNRWIACGKAAQDCCQRHISAVLKKSNASQPLTCPGVWDSVACLDETLAGTTAYADCPNYYIQNMYLDPESKASRICHANGSWFRHPMTGRTWTNYTECSKESMHMRTLLKITLSTNICSILFLVPACAIFILFKQLRVQHRIRIHVCLFTSLIMCSIFTILWDTLITSEYLAKPAAGSSLDYNTAGCKLLIVLVRYFRTASYFWMFCEGFYIHTLVIKAFNIPSNLKLYYFIGWGLSIIPIGVYSMIRATNPLYDIRCWIYSIEVLEWIVFGPNVLCIALDVFFLVNIIRILTREITTHPNEPSHFRRACKATFVLIPLFGIHFLFGVYRRADLEWYEITSRALEGIQGIIVSLIFCFCNGEVQGYIKNVVLQKFPKLAMSKQKRKFSTSSSTHLTHSINRTPSFHKDFISQDVMLEKEINVNKELKEVTVKKEVKEGKNEQSPESKSFLSRENNNCYI